MYIYCSLECKQVCPRVSISSTFFVERRSRLFPKSVTRKTLPGHDARHQGETLGHAEHTRPCRAYSPQTTADSGARVVAAKSWYAFGSTLCLLPSETGRVLLFRIQLVHLLRQVHERRAAKGVQRPTAHNCYRALNIKTVHFTTVFHRGGHSESSHATTPGRTLHSGCRALHPPCEGCPCINAGGIPTDRIKFTATQARTMDKKRRNLTKTQHRNHLSYSTLTR